MCVCVRDGPCVFQWDNSWMWGHHTLSLREKERQLQSFSTSARSPAAEPSPQTPSASVNNTRSVSDFTCCFRRTLWFWVKLCVPDKTWMCSQAATVFFFMLQHGFKHDLEMERYYICVCWHVLIITTIQFSQQIWCRFLVILGKCLMLCIEILEVRVMRSLRGLNVWLPEACSAPQSSWRHRQKAPENC